ncbi:MAG: DUF2069 domain-containing protein [Pseudomonadales bacterium]|nr:DUF2069 domain-containing protein [Pseudomonadales bacterium]
MSTDSLQRRTALAKRLALTCYAVLILLLSVEVFGIVRLEPATRAFWWVISIGPLIVFLPGLLRGAWKTYLWLCFVLLAYFMFTVDELFRAPADVREWLELVFNIVLFNAAMFYARWRQREIAGCSS